MLMHWKNLISSQLTGFIQVKNIYVAEPTYTSVYATTKKLKKLFKITIAGYHFLQME